MSYIIHVWEAPVPATAEDAERIHRLLAIQTAPQNPKFVAFARKLTDRFPCIMTLDDDEVEYAVWTDGPLDGVTDKPIYGVGLRTDALREVMPAITDAARGLGLVVYDMQGGLAFLPNGKALGAAPAQIMPTGTDAERLQSKAHALSILKEALQPDMDSHGFVSASYGFVSKLKDLTQHIVFDFSIARESQIRLQIQVEPNFKGAQKKAMEAHHSGACNLMLPVLFKQAALPPFSALYRTGVQFKVRSEGDLRGLAASLAPCMRDLVLGELAKVVSIEQMNERFGDYRVDPGRVLGSHGKGDLVVAFLARNPLYPSLIDERITAESDEERRRGLIALKRDLAALVGFS